MVIQALGDGPTAIGTWEVDTPVKEVVSAQDLATGWLSPYGLPTVLTEGEPKGGNRHSFLRTSKEKNQGAPILLSLLWGRGVLRPRPR